jgi:hypothetical protein
MTSIVPVTSCACFSKTLGTININDASNISVDQVTIALITP